ncbi:MAG: helix-turn-helix domain-containing protein [Pseudomonadota bacterium]|nr:helix-turn-helix domain-containing protein [Pseudomonadota bacterium]
MLLRAGGGTLLLTLALLLIRDARGDRIVWLFLLFALGICGFLAGNTPDPGLKPPGSAAVVASLLSGNAAVFLWWFSLAVFDDEFRFDAWKLGVGAAWFVIALLDRGFLGARFDDIGLSWLLVGIGAGMVGHLAYRLLRDLNGDLVEPRRRVRWLIAAAPPTLLLVDLAVDVAFGFEWKPRGFTMAQNAAILTIAAQMARSLLRADPGILTFRQPAAVPPAVTPASTPAAAAAPDAVLLRRLRTLMDCERIYRDPELTFAAFAARMGAPEPEVRRLVNQHLGHRHFRSFLNAYRVAEAREALADPARSRGKLVGLAFDVGFASLASFNRAFKQFEGRSPSEFRAERLSLTAAPDGRLEVEAPSEPDLRLRTGF